MNCTPTFMIRATCARSRTAAIAASILISTVSLLPRSARADEAEGASPRATTEVAPPPARVVIDPRAIRDWQEGDPVPPGYHPVQRMRKGAVIAGAVTFGVLYFISVLVAAVGTDAANANHSNNDVAGLYAPVVGPFITMARSSLAIADVFLVLDGAGQAAGAILLVYGLTSPQTVLVRDANYGRPVVFPRPMLLGKDGAGLGFSGSF
jgi:hypothetical protein